MSRSEALSKEVTSKLKSEEGGIRAKKHFKEMVLTQGRECVRLPGQESTGVISYVGEEEVTGMRQG